MIDFEKDKQESLTSIDDGKALSSQVVKLKNLEDQIKDTEDYLKKLKSEMNYISGEVIPNMMQEMNLKTMKLADGSAIEVKPVYGASITEAKKEEAFKWLRDNDLGNIIKNEVTVSFGRNEDNKAAEYAVLAQGQGYEPVQKIGVHPQTLKAVVRERLESGREMPSDLFKTYAGNSTKITRRT